jgi:hypothetical protein
MTLASGVIKGILRAPLALVLSLASSVSPGFAVASDAPQTAITKLAHAGEVSCQPSLPFFCSNIHVACSGTSSIKTFPFKIRASFTNGSIDSPADTGGIREQYESGPVEWASDGAYVILRPRVANGYIKLLSDGTYSFRLYAQHVGTMSRGHCN